MGAHLLTYVSVKVLMVPEVLFLPQVMKRGGIQNLKVAH